MQPGIVLIIALMLSAYRGANAAPCSQYIVSDRSGNAYFIDEAGGDYWSSQHSLPSYNIFNKQANSSQASQERYRPQSTAERLAWAKAPPVHSFSSTSLDDDTEPQSTVHPGFNPQAHSRLEKMSLQQAYNYCHQNYGCLSNPENRHRIINTYPLHQFSVFREVMKSLPDYEAAMFDLVTRINNRPLLKRAIAHSYKSQQLD